MKLQKLFFAAVIVLSANGVIAQDINKDSHMVTINIPDVALLDLEDLSGTSPVGTITLAGTVPTEAGLPMTFGAAATNATIWMNYSSILGSAPSRIVTVSITGGTLPSGLKLTVSAAVYSGSGEGTTGTPTGIISLDGSAKNIIEGIGSAYTGNGKDNGHLLTYQLGYADTANYAGLDFNNSDDLTITYTLSDGL